MDWRTFIDSDPAVIGGKPRIKGTRIGVVFLLDRFASGWTADDVLKSYPHLTPEALQAVFAFASEMTEDVRIAPFQRDAA